MTDNATEIRLRARIDDLEKQLAECRDLAGAKGIAAARAADDLARAQVAPCEDPGCRWKKRATAYHEAMAAFIDAVEDAWADGLPVDGEPGPDSEGT